MIDASKLAMRMLKWEVLQRQADVIRTGIEDVVLAMKKTQVVGNVTAKYSGGRRSFDYETAAMNCEDVNAETIARYTTTKVVVDWRELCHKCEIVDGIPFTKSAPSVSVRIK